MLLVVSLVIRHSLMIIILIRIVNGLSLFYKWLFSGDRHCYNQPRSYPGLSVNSFQERVEKSATRVTKLVFPHDTNHIRTLYGGTAMQWMDEVGFLVCTRFSRQKVVTVSIDRVDFKVPIAEGSIVELKGKVIRVGNTSMTALVQIFREDMFEGNQVLAVSAEMVFVAVDGNNRPTQLSVHQSSTADGD